MEVARPDFDVYAIWLLDGSNPTKNVARRELQVIGEAESDWVRQGPGCHGARIPRPLPPQNTTGTQHDVSGGESQSEDHEQEDTYALVVLLLLSTLLN